MKIPLYHVDAFTSEVFSGNPAAVCLLDRWHDDPILQAIAFENNISLIRRSWSPMPEALISDGSLRSQRLHFAAMQHWRALLFSSIVKIGPRNASDFRLAGAESW
jgi:hypothetical protein